MILTMSLAKDINEKLDEIIAIKNEMNKMIANINEDSQITNIKTGQKASLDDANNVVQDMLGRIYHELNKITNNGKNIKGIFNNTYYVNDLLQDKTK